MRQYTPLFDDIADEHGLITAAVYGYVWRCCQRERGVCDASLQTIADDLGVSRRTIVTHIKLLVDHNLITDKTPEYDRKPHIYLVQDMLYTREIDSLDDKAARELNAGGGEINALALGQQMHQTRAADAHKDTKGFEDTYIYTKSNGHINNSGIYEHPLPDDIQEIISAISAICKTRFYPKTEDDYEVAACMVLEGGHGADEVSGFGRWWEQEAAMAKAAGKKYPYGGMPALKSFLDEFPNYVMSLNGNGQAVDMSYLDNIPTFEDGEL